MQFIAAHWKVDTLKPTWTKTEHNRKKEGKISYQDDVTGRFKLETNWKWGRPYLMLYYRLILGKKSRVDFIAHSGGEHVTYFHQNVIYFS